MIDRSVRIARLDAAWRQASIARISGPRGIGKTSLAKSLPKVEMLDYLRRQGDFELPVVSPADLRLPFQT